MTQARIPEPPKARPSYAAKALDNVEVIDTVDDENGSTLGDGPAVSNPGDGRKEYGAVHEGNAVFEPDDWFLKACHSKGVMFPSEEFRPKTVADFLHSTRPTEADKRVAESRLASYDMVRARKMALVLEERERLIGKAERDRLAARQNPGGSSSGNVDVFRRSHCLMETMLARAKASQCRSRHLNSVHQFVDRRKVEEGARQEAAHREVKVRHLLTIVQKREIEKMNERVLAERRRRMEADRKLRDQLRNDWTVSTSEQHKQMEKKITLFEDIHQQVSSAKLRVLKNRAAERDRRLKQAEEARKLADKERVESLERKASERDEIVARKQQRDEEKARAFRFKGELQGAYSNHVAAKNRKIEEYRAHEIVAKQREREQRAEQNRQDNSRYSTDKSEEAAVTNELRRERVLRQRCDLDAEQLKVSCGRVEVKNGRIAAACREKARQQAFKAEALKIEAEGKEELALRCLREQLVQQASAARTIAEKHSRGDERVDSIKRLQFGLVDLINQSTDASARRRLPAESLRPTPPPAAPSSEAKPSATKQAHDS
ncbi:hypothetical protein DIPPA_29036 [Diplonema papillatum]|nr:hypothetical protein DIPPA_29036 [Diplonema papillatum]